MEGSIPTRMKALQLTKHFTEGFPRDASEYLDNYFVISEVDVPKPSSSEVLVRVERSPINPADLSGLKGTYDASRRPELPFTPGAEGSGVVVSSGGFLGWFLVGKRVAFVCPKGTVWAEYALVPAVNCISITPETSFDIAASPCVNPMTVLGFVNTAYDGGHKSMVHTAGASALGKMLIKYCQTKNIDVIAVVRRDEQVEELKALGAKYIFNTSEENWKEEFKATCAELNCTLAFDAVAGDLTGQVLHNMPKNSVVKVYGGLSEKPCVIPPSDFIFQNKRVEGFWLVEYIKTRSKAKLFMWQREIASLLPTVFASSIAHVYTLEEVGTAISTYTQNMSGGKILFAPQGLDKAEKGEGEEGKGKEKEGSEEAEKETEEPEKKEEAATEEGEKKPLAVSGDINWIKE